MILPPKTARRVLGDVVEAGREAKETGKRRFLDLADRGRERRIGAENRPVADAVRVDRIPSEDRMEPASGRVDRHCS